MTARPPSDALFRELADAMPQLVWTATPAGFADFANKAMVDYVGLARDDAGAIENWYTAIHPDETEQALREWWHAVKTTAVATIECRLRRAADGQYRWMQLRAEAAHDASGAVSKWYGTAVDIHDARQLAMEMQKSEEKYRLLFDSNPHAMWVYDPETLRFLAVNQAAVKRYGYSVDEFLAMTVRDIWSSDTGANAALEARMRGLQLQGKQEDQRRHRTKDGSTVDAEISGDGLMFEGKPARLVHVLDVTERLKAEREVQRLARAQRMLSACNESLIRATREDELLGRICRIAVDVGGYRVAWVGFAQNDAGSSVERVAYAGEKEDVVLTVPASWSESNPGGRGTVGRAMRSGKIAVVEDAALQPHSEEWAQLVGEHHIKGVVSLPLCDGDHTFGVLCLYAPDALRFSAPELALMEEMANDLAFGITNLRKLEEQKRLQQALLKAASYDALTGLPNRQQFSEALLRASRASAGAPGHCAVLLVNLDNFKTLNKTLGLTNGDRLLQLVAQRIKTRVGAADTTARLGGDEFLVLQEGLGPDAESAARQAAASARRLLDALEQPFGLGDFEHATTACVGVTVFKGLEPSVGDLLNQADLALDHAKAIGRNSVRFFDPGMQLAIAERAALESDMGLALAQHEMELHFQPQADGDGRLRGVEALLRWKHPQRGMVSPATFIPLAEESGLILTIGQWVVESACAVLKTWQDQPLMAGLTMAVNVSASQFRHPDFVEQVAGAVRRSGIAPSQLKLELTESILVYDMKAIIEKMYALRSLGVGFSLDDFGTGYSSLSYLKQMPLDQLKIDQSFVREVMTNAKDAAIAKTVIALAHSLGLNVIAEGVELQEQRDFLLQNGCDAYQGYLLSRPLPLKQLEEFVARHG
jgi:diguanylate cyclase (GGDEF)-like protein/PAS domain S-box-containing protein